MSEKRSIDANKAHFLQLMLPLKCTTAQNHQTICAEISSRALATFQNIGKTRKQGRLFQINVYCVRIMIKFYTFSYNLQTL